MKSKPQIQNLRSSSHPLEFNTDDALDKVVRVFGERGYHATVISELSEVMGMSVANIYKVFTDKRGLFLAALDHQGRQHEAELAQALGAGRNGRERLLALFAQELELCCGRAPGQASLITGAAQELVSFDPETAARVAAVFQRREQLLADLVGQGVADQSLPAVLEVAAVTRYLLCFLQGMRVVGKATPERADMQAAVAVALRQLD